MTDPIIRRDIVGEMATGPFRRAEANMIWNLLVGRLSAMDAGFISSALTELEGTQLIDRTPTSDPQDPRHSHQSFAARDACAECRAYMAKRWPSADPVTERPEVVCLCGSTRFYDMFQAANYDLTMLGKIVLSVGFYPHSKAIHGHGEGVGHDSTEKAALDELHKRKIDLADRVYVLNVGGYIGDSTRSEIEYAVAHGKPVDYLETVASDD